MTTTAPDDTSAIGGDLSVHRLGYGAVPLPDPGVRGEPADRDAALAVVRAAVEQGVDLVDTADSYGPSVSEQVIAEALHPLPAGPGHRHRIARLDALARGPRPGPRGEAPSASGRARRGPRGGRRPGRAAGAAPAGGGGAPPASGAPRPRRAARGRAVGDGAAPGLAR